MRPLGLAIVVMLQVPSALGAQASELPPLVANGLEAYRTNGAEAAVQTWLKDSPVGSDENARVGTIAGLHTVERAYGRMIGYDVLLVVPLGPHATRFYVVILYERGPAYAWFDLYKTESGWIMPSFLFNTKPDLILPPRFLRSVMESPNQRLKLSARGGRVVGNESVLSAAAAGRSLSAFR